MEFKKEILSEKLSRIRGALDSPTSSVLLLTATCSKMSETEFFKKTYTISCKAKREGHGFILLKGNWSGESSPSYPEYPLFLFHRVAQKSYQDALQWMKEYDLNAVIQICDKPILIRRDKTKVPLETSSTLTVEGLYRELRQVQGDFILEAAYGNDGFMTRLAHYARTRKDGSESPES